MTLSEAVLPNSEREFFEQSSLFVWLVDRAGRLLWANRAWHSAVDGATAYDGAFLRDFVHPDDRDLWEAEFQRGASSGAEFELTYRLRNRSEPERWTTSKVALHRDSSGALDGFLGYGLDVTESVRRLTAAERQVAELRHTVEHGGQVVHKVLNGVLAWISYIDADLRVRYINEAYEGWLGQTNDEVAGKHVSDVIGSDLFEEVKEHAHAALGGEARRFAMRRPRRDGSTAHLQVSYLPDREASGTVAGYIAIIEDVTATQEAQRRIAWSEEMLSRALTAARMCAWSWDPAERSTTRTINAEAVMGIAPTTSATSESIPYMAPADMERMNEVVAEAVRERKPYSLQYRWLRPNTSEWIWLETFGDVQVAEDARVMVYGVALDITDRKAAEEALQQALKAKDEILGMVSHELRTPLTTLKGNAAAIRRWRSSLDEALVTTALADIETDADRLQRIVENMLTLARADLSVEDDFEPVLLSRVLALEVRDHQRRHPVPPVVYSAPEASVVVVGNETHIRHVVGNLLSNAVKYGGKSPEIELALIEEAGEAIVSVTDAGMGLAPEAREKVFEAFFRTESAVAAAAGAGLGLTVCKRLVELHGGRVWVESEPGRTSFRFALPLAGDA